jgi:hypothetical protein
VARKTATAASSASNAANRFVRRGTDVPDGSSEGLRSAILILAAVLLLSLLPRESNLTGAWHNEN